MGSSMREDIQKGESEYKNHEAISIWHIKISDNDQTFYFFLSIFLAICFGMVNGFNASQVKYVE